MPGPGSGLGVTGLCALQVGSFGNGTVLRDSSEVELVMVLSGFHSFQEEARRLDDVLSLLCEKLRYCQDLRSLQLQDLRLVQGVPSAVAFTIQSWETAEPITVTVVPAYGVLGKGKPTRLTRPPSRGTRSFLTSPSWPRADTCIHPFNPRPVLGAG